MPSQPNDVKSNLGELTKFSHELDLGPLLLDRSRPTRTETEREEQEIPASKKSKLRR